MNQNGSNTIPIQSFSQASYIRKRTKIRIRNVHLALCCLKLNYLNLRIEPMLENRKMNQLFKSSLSPRVLEKRRSTMNGRNYGEKNHD